MLSKLLPPPAYDTLVVQRQTTNGGTDRYTYNKVNHHHKRWIRSAATSAPPPPQPSTIKTIEPTPRGSSLNRAVVVQNNPKTKLPQQDGFLKQQQTQTPTSTTNKRRRGSRYCVVLLSFNPRTISSQERSDEWTSTAYCAFSSKPQPWSSYPPS